MNSFLDKFLIYFGLLLILAAIIMMVTIGIETVKLVAAASTLSRTHHNPFGLEVATTVVTLVAGFFFGLRLGLGRRRRTDQVEEEDYAVPMDHIDQG
jgi:uncharacterized BrkB/YihY/UPF0761 family membrane protein